MNKTITGEKNAKKKWNHRTIQKLMAHLEEKKVANCGKKIWVKKLIIKGGRSWENQMQ